MRMSSAIVSTPARQHGGNPQCRACLKKNKWKLQVFHAKFDQPLHCCSYCVCDWLWCGNGSFNAARGGCGESQSARQTQIFRVPWPRYMWKPLHSRCRRENLLLTGKAPAKLDCTEKEVGGHTQMGAVVICDAASDSGPWLWWGSLHHQSSRLVSNTAMWIPSPCLTSLNFQKATVSKTILSTLPCNYPGKGGSPQLKQHVPCSSRQNNGKNTKKPEVLKRNILLQEITDLALWPKCSHYIKIPIHVSGNSTYKPWWIEISQIIMQSA